MESIRENSSFQFQLFLSPCARRFPSYASYLSFWFFFLLLRNLIIKCPPSDNYVLPPLLAQILNKRTGAYSREYGIQICRLAGKWFVGLSRVRVSFTAFPFRWYFLAHYFLYHSHFWIPLIMRIFVVNLQLHLSPQWYANVTITSQ